MDILGKRKLWYTISTTVIVIGLLFLMINGLNLGIDFNGGTLMEFSFAENVTAEEVRAVLERIEIAEDSKIQQSESAGEHGVIIRAKTLESEEIVTVDNAIREEFKSAEMLRTEMVGPTIGRELRINALLALIAASIAIVAYISFRFEFRFAVVSIITLMHDVLITLGIFAILGREVNTPFVAALLTIVGYSINDTIVIFDRIRENMKLMHKVPFIKQANTAVVDTLPRSINTSITTLITILAIYFFGGASIQTFMLALFIGMFAGTYSSIFVASPLLVTWQERISK
ncbi:protein translocase subunit SecF [Halanaerobium congolense]|uniref:Protein-export membrane protein SecF n=1 Tax=Halanaerobium congolense TaxID=54121 RepID=A0A1G9QJ63_9FIRM|nr:protein translocase subunit SecF [Halanaerobium congolense]OEG62340.1 MAG: protein-export membrane protein SecF [Halanaerobium sp. MDAL1]PTX16813.1 protein translocase subunit secF [Halanaerobium congolense]TDP11075.1 protein translocase subunit secF [Halanaerobium congolense]TDS31155.1 protein translocase subunit secF [Halanaerobium congolense]SDE78917.1 protein translocase subunit secF [Halanaerobium congolense]